MAILDTGMILAILNLHVATMAPSMSQLNPGELIKNKVFVPKHVLFFLYFSLFVFG